MFLNLTTFIRAVIFDIFTGAAQARHRQYDLLVQWNAINPLRPSVMIIIQIPLTDLHTCCCLQDNSSLMTISSTHMTVYVLQCTDMLKRKWYWSMIGAYRVARLVTRLSDLVNEVSIAFETEKRERDTKDMKENKKLI